MKTEFSLTQLADPDIAEADKILRACVHCGFCTATCPTYVLLGDELDSPRGRIYLIKEMLEKDKPPTADVVKHIDRCLSCLACMTTCPSGVHYMHLVDQARVRIERDYSRPLPERALRAVLAWVLPRPKLFRASMIMARLARPFAALLPVSKAAATPGLMRRIKAMLALAPNGAPGAGTRGRQRLSGHRRAARAGRAAAGLRPAGAGAAHQPGRHQPADAPWRRGRARQGRAMLRRAHPSPRAGRRRAGAGARQHRRVAEGGANRAASTPSWSRHRAAARSSRTMVSCCARTAISLAPRRGFPRWQRISPNISRAFRYIHRNQKGDLTVAYHSACSLQHGQKITGLPKELLSKNGFVVKDVPESHLCCGSAGTYNILQPDIASRLRDRKIANLATVKPDMIAAGNIGCMVQIAGGTSVPVVHTIELLDWATGGPKPGSS